MDENLRSEVARLKEHLNRVHQVCELHRKLGEDIAYENRELRRKIDTISKLMTIFSRHFDLLDVVNAKEKEECRHALDIVIRSLEK